MIDEQLEPAIQMVEDQLRSKGRPYGIVGAWFTLEDGYWTVHGEEGKGQQFVFTVHPVRGECQRGSITPIDVDASMPRLHEGRTAVEKARERTNSGDEALERAFAHMGELTERYRVTEIGYEFADGAWHVGLFRVRGDGPKAMQIEIDSTSGACVLKSL